MISITIVSLKNGNILTNSAYNYNVVFKVLLNCFLFCSFMKIKNVKKNKKMVDNVDDICYIINALQKGAKKKFFEN